MISKILAKRIDEGLRRWNLAVEHTFETESSFLAFGKCKEVPVVMKVSRTPNDEWLSGETLRVFNGQGTVRVYDYVPGAVLLERLNPGTPLSSLALNGRDDDATDILAAVIEAMSQSPAPVDTFPTVEDWGDGFSRYLASADNQISRELITQAQTIYAALCKSQRNVRLLHGDLHHYNVLFDSIRGWTAIDPKGVIGELEYELGAALRNPNETPHLFMSYERVESRIKQFAASLELDSERVLLWAFAQAVLSAIWLIEDGFTIEAHNPSLILANAIRPE